MAFLAVVGLLQTAARATDVHSNGAGGGAWSDPGTWRTRVVPGSNDVVTVAGDDLVIVDLTDEKRIACQELNVDPRGMLTFKPGAGKIVLNVNGIVEAYGAVRLDMSRSDEDSAELRLAGATPDKRILRLVRGGSLVLGGRDGLPGGRCNVALISGPVPDTNAPAADPTGKFEAGKGTSVDFRRAAIRDVQMTVSSIDNTGAAPNERLSIVGCRFSGRANLLCYSCDTPLVADNEFVCETSPGPALLISGGAMAEIRGNTVRGPYNCGIDVSTSDAAVVSNSVEGASVGFHAYYPNLMVKHFVARRCDTGFHHVNFATGVTEDCVADDCKRSYLLQNIRGLQAINCRAINVASNATPLFMENSELTLVNCQISTNGMEVTVPSATGLTFDSWQYLVVRIQGSVPPNSQVSVVTANPAKPLPPGAADPNVRNSPARLDAAGWTPLPQTMAALTVRAWTMTSDKRTLPTPEYILRVLGPAPATNAPPTVLKELRIQPSVAWQRPDPNELKPTLEVAVP